MPLDFWADELPVRVGWADVNGFLALEQREGPRLEYRSQYSAAPDVTSRAKHSHPRFADTVAAMANSGGGLIFFGVETDKHDCPVRWPTLKAGGIRPQTLEGDSRNYLDPYVPLEIGIASKDDEAGQGEVVVVRIPDVAAKPVFVDQRGILVREGEATVHARLDLIRRWLTEETGHSGRSALDFQHYISTGLRSDPPLVNIGVGPAQAWHLSRWNDASDAAITDVTRRLFPELVSSAVSDDLVEFRASEDAEDYRRWVWFKSSGSMMRSASLVPEADGRLDLLAICAEIDRTWRLAQAAIPVLLPRYPGEFQVGVAVSGATAGFSSREGMIFRFESVLFPPRSAQRQFARWFRFSSRRDAHEVLVDVLTAMTRSHGYTNVRTGIEELASLASSPASRQTVLPNP
jgi:hypothetical protein